jgi:hypothetical protein
MMTLIDVEQMTEDESDEHKLSNIAPEIFQTPAMDVTDPARDDQ